MISSQKRSGLSRLKARKSSRRENPSRVMKRQTLVCSTNSRDGSQITPGVWQGSGGGVKGAGGSSARQSSLVYFSAVTNSRHLHQQFCVVDGVYHAVVAHTNAPLVITASELFAARRTGIGGEIFQARNDARDQLGGELFEFSLRA